MQAILLSAASTHSNTAVRSYYGMTATPVAGGTVVLADLTSAGAPGIDVNNPPSSAFAVISFASTASTVHLPAGSIQVGQGLTVAFTSTRNLTLHVD